jgi:hypothetical protein
MPLFSSASGVQISDSTFYDIGGDLNVHSARPIAHQTSEPVELGAESARLSLGPGRTDRHVPTTSVLLHGALLFGVIMALTPSKIILLRILWDPLAVHITL